MVPRETETETAHTKVEAERREPQGSSSAAKSTKWATPVKPDEQTFEKNKRTFGFVLEEQHSILKLATLALSLLIMKGIQIATPPQEIYVGKLFF